MASKKDQSIARAGFAENVEAKRRYDAFKILPSKVVANHEHNYARAALYDLATELPELKDHPALESDKCCFTRAEVLRRVASFDDVGQEQSIKVTRTGVHTARVAEGYLRHIAALFMEVTGTLANSELRDGLRADAVEEPKTPEAQLRAAFGNRAENEERKATTPIDDAWYARRLTAMQVSRDEIAKRMGVSKRTVDRLLSLLSLHPSIQLDVHEGRKTVSQVLAKASENGQGTAKGPNGGIGRKAIRRRKVDARPTESMTPEQVDAFLDALVGDKMPAEIDDPLVRRYIAYADAPPEPKPDKAPKRTTVDADGNKISPQGKKMPKKGGKQAA